MKTASLSAIALAVVLFLCCATGQITGISAGLALLVEEAGYPQLVMASTTQWECWSVGVAVYGNFPKC